MLIPKYTFFFIIASVGLSDICGLTNLPCRAGTKFRDATSCVVYNECGPDGRYLTKRFCPDGTGFNSKLTDCVPLNTFLCPSPVYCVASTVRDEVVEEDWERFPTNVVIGGTLGFFACLSVFVLLFACIKKHTLVHKRHRRTFYNLYRRPDPRRRVLPVTHFPGLDRNFHLKYPDRRERLPSIYETMDNNALQIRPLYHRPLSVSDNTSSSDYSYPVSSSNNSPYDPENVDVIAGSFIFHPPDNVPRHAPRDNISYDSFKNNHRHMRAYDNGGMMNSTFDRAAVFNRF